LVVVERTDLDVDAMAKLPPAYLDDGRSWQGVLVKKPWGHEVEIYCEGAVSVTRLVLTPDGETSMHCHPGKTALLMVSEGSCHLETLRTFYHLKAGELAMVTPGAFHRIRTEEGVKLIEIESPPNKSNIVRLMDKYGRGQGYARASG
jgi:mannose-6-phosphate isomerase-like protein (cupin superfamily)